MRVALVAGGRGLRMGSLGADLPKPMLPFGGRPLLAHQIELAAAAGLREVVVLAGHRAQVIGARRAELASAGTRVEVVVERAAAGSGGCLRHAAGDGPLLVIFGDIMLRMDLAALIAAHRTSGAVATVVVHPNDHPQDSDLVELATGAGERGGAIGGGARRGASPITAIHRKPHPADLLVRNLSAAGVFVVEPELLRRIPREGPTDLVHDLLRAALADGLRLAAYPTGEYLKDIGTPERYARVTRDWQSGRVSALCRDRPRPAAFLDRDGTLNRDVGLVSRPEQIELLPGAAAAVRRLNDAGIRAIVVTNQSAVARGLCDEEGLGRIHACLEMQLGRAGAYLDGIYACPHHPDAGYPGEVPRYKRPCECRKPGTGMIEEAARDFALDLPASALFGDSPRDVEAAVRAGLGAAYHLGEAPPAVPDSPRIRRARDLGAAVDAWLGPAPPGGGPASPLL